MDEYIVSARKYRPRLFDAVVGQEALTTTLKNAVKTGKLAHAYLFCGPRGVGKTTCARIFAKAINCMTPTADGEACNECESCRSFNEQRSLNIFELDAASNNSVEHIRTLTEQTRIPPQMGRYKVFIIDEVHMLSPSAFNAFLKTLEEPPAHVIFILATTEKHKILPTILSRCQIYDFERMTVRNTINHLKYVAEKEGIRYEEEALAVIAEKADGGMRDALSIFDQTTSFCQGNITYKKVIEDLNVLDSENYFRLVDYSLENKVTEAMVLLNEVIGKGFDGGLLIQGLAKHVRNVLMAHDPQTLPLLEVSEQQRQRYEEQAKRCPVPFLYKALQIMNRCDINYRQSNNKRLLVELTVIEVAQITQPADADSLGSGRRPRRLKTLFKNLMQQTQPMKTASQVAVAQRSAASMKAQHQAVTTKSHAVATAVTGGVSSDVATDIGIAAQNAASSIPSGETSATTRSRRRDTLKLDTLACSWDSLSRQARKSSVIIGTQEPESSADEHEPIKQDELELQWLSMCNRMPQTMVAVAQRMKNLTPVLKEDAKVEVEVGNVLIKDDMEKILPRILATLKNKLHNSDITLTIKVNENREPVKILSRREQFEVLRENNPSVEKLRETFGLELA